MRVRRYGDANWQQLRIPHVPEVFPRRSRYGDDLAVNKYGLLPVEDMVDLIEWAFLEGQIDGLKADLAYCWLKAKETAD